MNSHITGFGEFPFLRASPCLGLSFTPPAIGKTTLKHRLSTVKAWTNDKLCDSQTEKESSPKGKTATQCFGKLDWSGDIQCSDSFPSVGGGRRRREGGGIFPRPCQRCWQGHAVLPGCDCVPCTAAPPLLQAVWLTRTFPGINSWDPVHSVVCEMQVDIPGFLWWFELPLAPPWDQLDLMVPQNHPRCLQSKHDVCLWLWEATGGWSGSR